ncbi:hypothetical protein ABZY20_34520 [Streptomyces sp. NPDC006624]|uniref:hypothetical protein n=1 Tax=Streptomyces sp. NPDC006624 TaxID=3154892 RepID=UPI0033AD07BC
MLDHLRSLLDRAGDAGLDVVAVFDGWLSGFDGRRPAIVLRSQTTAGALARRGITAHHNPS